jgi:hypothetical protein
MELTARIGGYVGPAMAAFTTLCLLVECIINSGCSFCGGGKCIPAVLIAGASVAQGLTFLLFRSDLFCGNTDVIRECDMGDAGYRSVQASLVYAFCLVLYYCGPTPNPLLSSMKSKTAATQGKKKRLHPIDDTELGREDETKKKKKKKKTKTAAIGPGKEEDWTKEMYEQRRKERRSKSRGVSGRSKEEIFDDSMGESGRRSSNGSGKNKKKKKKKDKISSGSNKQRDYNESVQSSVVLYEPMKVHDGGGTGRNSNRRRSRERLVGRQFSSSTRSFNSSDSGSYGRDPQSPGGRGGGLYDDYVDTDPDGMDWSAITPNQREAYYNQQRKKKAERRERELHQREIERLREWEAGLSRGPSGDTYDNLSRRPSGETYDNLSRRPSGDTYDNLSRRPSGETYDQSRRTSGDDTYDRDFSRGPSGDTYDYSRGGAGYDDGYAGEDDGRSYYSERDGSGSRYDDEYAGDDGQRSYYSRDSQYDEGDYSYGDYGEPPSPYTQSGPPSYYSSSRSRRSAR